MPDDSVGNVWNYSDEQAQMLKRIEVLEAVVAALQRDNATFQAAVHRMAEYQGVKHLLAPQ